MIDEEFLRTFNEYYPFERYIVNDPKPINYLFDDALLTEIFVPNVESSRLDLSEDIYIKLLCKGVEIRLAYFDFSDSTRENIRDIIYNDFEDYVWESMYVDTEDETPLKEVLLNQIDKIKSKYGKCNIKEHFIMTSTINLIKDNI